MRRLLVLTALTALVAGGLAASPAAAQSGIESCTLVADREVVRPGETVFTTLTVNPNPAFAVIAVLVDGAVSIPEVDTVVTGPFVSFSGDQLVDEFGPDGTVRIELARSFEDPTVVCSVEFAWAEQPTPTTTTPSPTTTTPTPSTTSTTIAPTPDAVVVRPTYTG